MSFYISANECFTGIHKILNKQFKTENFTDMQSIKQTRLLYEDICIFATTKNGNKQGK